MGSDVRMETNLSSLSSITSNYIKHKNKHTNAYTPTDQCM